MQGSSNANAKKSFMKMKWWKENNGVDPSGSKNSDILSIYLSTILPTTHQSDFGNETFIAWNCEARTNWWCMVAECCCVADIEV